VIPDAEHELVIERVAAVDVAKAAGKVCVRLPGKAGRRFSRVWDVPARTGAITDLGEQLVESCIEKVTVESTSDYWRIWYYLLEAAGLSVQLVNARDVKNGQVDREGSAAPVVRASGPDPAAARLHPAA
jgi:transposase